MALVWYESNGTTLVTTAHAFGAVAAGATSTAWEPWIYWNKGTAGGEATNVTMLVQALDGSDWLSSGLSVLDQREIEVRIKGYAATGDATWTAPVTTTRQRIGTDLPFSIGTIPGNCGVQLSIVYAPRNQSGTSATDVTVQFPVIYNEIAQANVLGLNEAGGYGVLTGQGDPYVSEFVTAPLATETGTPDDYVNLSASWHVGAGVSYRIDASTHQLNQNDSAPAALTSGQAYYALLSQPIAGGARVVTKGVKAAAASAVVPALPADSLPIATVLVAYGAGGSVITTANISQLAVDGRLLVSDAGGLDVTIGPGRALVRRALITRTLTATETLPDDATTTIYLVSDGSLSQTSGDIALAEVTTVGGDITVLTDLRRYVAPGYQHAVVWNDMSVISPSAINPVGPDGSMTVISDAADYLGCLQADAIGESCVVQFQVGHGYAGGDLKPHIHVVRNDGADNAGDVEFEAKFRVVPLKGDAFAWTAYAAGDTTVQPADGAGKSGLIYWTLADSTYSFGVSDVILAVFKRSGLTTGSVAITSADLHGQLASFGTVSEGGPD